MKNVLIYIPLFFVFNNCYATNDSLPDCINKMKISTESFVTEYEYKGQRWFVFTKIIPPAEPNVSDKMYYTKFYDTGCKLVCTWTKGGIAGFNKVTPDTVQKEKIKKIEIVPKDSIKKYSANSTALPDTLVKMALAKNSNEIKEFLYQDKILYTFRYSFSYKPIPEKGSVTIDNPYYDESGKVILIYKSAIQATYTRAERWVPASVKRSDVTEVKNGVWIREKNNYKKLPLITQKQKEQGDNVLPDTIVNLTHRKQSQWIEQRSWKGEYLYRFQDVSDTLTSKVTFAGSYYNSKGEIVFYPKEVGIAYWWHYYNNKFIGTQFRPGYR